ncbi:hypothetical protein SNEBB_002999 [Seison nebaliae]|nr:hypothetical protein SNEBB_002999 [Seison nebaliae]
MENGDDTNTILQKEFTPNPLTPLTEEEEVKKSYGDTRVITISNKPYAIIAQRINESAIDFNKPLINYKSFFGDINNFWLGLDMLVSYTNRAKSRRFRVEFYNIQPSNDAFAFFDYQSVYVKPEYDDYRLTFGRLRSSNMPQQWSFVKDSINGTLFSSEDMDNDKYVGNCAKEFQYAFWFNDCSSFRLFDKNKPISIKTYGQSLTATKVRILMELKVS